MYYEFDDYFEPGEFDEKIEELKNELRESVKKKSTMKSRNCVRKTKNYRGSRTILSLSKGTLKEKKKNAKE